MRFGLIIPPSVRVQDCGDFADALSAVGLRSSGSDHGNVSDVLAIVVHETSLFRRDRIKYFSIYGQLFAGNAVLYAFAPSGETVDVKQLPPVMFYRDMAEVEHAIDAGAVKRPQMAYGETVYWRWPDPPPSEDARERAAGVVAQALEQGDIVTIDGDTHLLTVPNRKL
jgi:hypothetical protein